MEATQCPHCGEATITPRQKLIAGKWLDITCSACGGRACAQPVVMALMYFMYVWDLAFFGFMAVYEDSLIYIGIMLVIALILEFFIYYIPLSRMRPKKEN